MTPDQLRELADALEPMAAAPRFDDLPVAEFCAWMRQCADAQPVGWMHDGLVSTNKERVEHDEMRNRSCGFKPKPIIPLYAAPAAPQAEPKREPWSGYEAGHRAGYALALTERDPLRDALKTVIYELAALIPHPDKTLVDDWPCDNPADRQALQIAYTTAREACDGIGGSDAE